MGLLIFLLLFLALLVAWGLRSVPAGKQWLVKIFGRRFPKRLPEGLVWLPRWPKSLFDYEEYDIREEEFYILSDQLDTPFRRETITTTNGVEVVVRGVVGYYTIARKDPDGKRSWLRFLGWQSGQTLLVYSQVHDQDVINLIPPLIRSGLRALVPTFSIEELLGLSIDGLGLPPANRSAIAASRSTLQEQLTNLAREQAVLWGLHVTRIIVGDIDPNDAMKKHLQMKANALLEAQAAVIATDAYTRRAILILKAEQDIVPPPDQVRALVLELIALDNQRIAAENSGNLGRVVQNLVDMTGRAVANV